MFGTKHLIILAICAVVVAAGFFFARKWDLEKLTKVLFLIGIVSELIKIFYYIITNEAEYGGLLPKSDLPFHLCSIQILFFAALRFLKSEKIKELLISFMVPSCLLGGLAALLIPTSSSLNGLWILTVQYFGYHCAIMVFSMVILRGKVMKLEVKHYFMCLKFLLGLLFFAIYINSILSTETTILNFMYVVDPPKEGLPWLNKDDGWLMYMIRYGILVLGCVTACYAKPIIVAIRDRVRSKSAVAKNN